MTEKSSIIQQILIAFFCVIGTVIGTVKVTVLQFGINRQMGLRKLAKGHSAIKLQSKT